MRASRVFIAVLLSTGVAAAQSPVSVKKGLTLSGARRAIAAAVAQARKGGAEGAFAVVDEGGNVLALERLDGTFAAAGTISIGKARTAALFKKPTRFFEEVVNKGRTAMVAIPDFTPLMGGEPIVVDGQVVGAIGVSGASSAQQDAELALAGATAASEAARSGSAVSHIPHDQVAAAFAKGAPLIENESFKVHASHRDQAGKAEVHAREADVIHVLRGSATLVSGGTVVEGKVVEPDEIRGAAIAGGQELALNAGDVVVIPSGVPHWFKQVPGPFDYYVVKVH
jgi:uncharacterized protein GlcG (DUF336 family)/mannose-6-phosphate isomerase-like protein (cupin superfamily)